MRYLLFLLSFCLAGTVAADTVTIWPAEDATITEKSLDVPLGSTGSASQLLEAGATGPNEGGKKSRALLRFEVRNAIPANAQVSAARLTLTVVSTPPSTDQHAFHLRRVLVPWSESAATWTNRLIPPSPWSDPGGLSGVDYSSTVSQSIVVTGMAAFVFQSNPVLVGEVQAWLDTPESNAGWMLICEGESVYRSVRKFGAREWNVAAARPALEVEYTPPPASLVLTPGPLTNGMFQFIFSANANLSYTVERRGGFEGGHWEVLTNFAVGTVSGSVTVVDPVAPGGPQFYRVRCP